MHSSTTLRCALLLVLTACGSGPINTDESEPDVPAKDVGEGMSGDPWNCGELGLKCVGPLAIGECVDGQCTPRLGNQCSGAEFAPTCNDYCEALELSCAYQACEGATVWGWTGDPDWADLMCSDTRKNTATSLAVACDEPLDGLLTTFLCCCE